MKGIVTLVLAAAAIGLASRSVAQTEEISANTRVAALVPAGIATRDACIGFPSLAECTATLHASQNLNIPFVQLKERITGGLSLAASIHTFKPRVDSRRESQRAERQASEDLRALE